MEGGLVVLLFLFAALSGCVGYNIGSCEYNKQQISETQDAVLTCSGITHDRMVWRVNHTDGTVLQIGECTKSNGKCSVTNSNYTLSITPQNSTSQLTITGNHRTRIAGTVQCAGLDGGNMVDTATCDVRVVYTSYTITNCRTAVNTTDWTVSGSCDVDKIYASDDGYRCSWQYVPNVGGSANSGSVKASPKHPPQLHNCPDDIIEGDDHTCECRASPSEPSALVSWYGSGHAVSNTSTLQLTNVSRSLDGHSYTCSQYWGGFSTGHMNTTVYTLDVKYPPPSPPEISGTTSHTEGDSLSLTCTVTGGNPRVTSVTFYCGSHGDGPDTPDGETVVSSVSINSLSAGDNGTLCLCYATWNDRPSHKTVTSTVTITVIPASATPRVTDTSSTSAITTTTQSSNGNTDKMRDDDDNDDDDDDGTSVAYIAGGAAGAVVLIIVVIVIVVIIIRKRKDKAQTVDTRNKETEDEEEFVEHINLAYESADDLGLPQTKPGAVALRTPAAEDAAAAEQDTNPPAFPEDTDAGYSSIPSQFFDSSGPGRSIPHEPDSSLYSTVDDPVDNPHPRVEVDAYSSVDIVGENPNQSPDDGLYSTADGTPDNPQLAISQDTQPQDPNLYAVVNKSKSNDTTDPQNNEYAVVNKRPANLKQSAEPASGSDPDGSDPSEGAYAQVVKSKGGNPGPGESGAESGPQATPVPAVKPKPPVAAKPRVPGKPPQAGTRSDKNAGQGESPSTNDYEEVDLKEEETTRATDGDYNTLNFHLPPAPEEDYNTLNFHLPPAPEEPDDPDSQYSHLATV
ncbi:uncharacterized protein LOC143291381 [Babylonia areolata]|uniref:uncharacterized protein LOC143291381 n=1 Tax=Babylonia areolata TaxID=304850 RepID=UPI003FD5542D